MLQQFDFNKRYPVPEQFTRILDFSSKKNYWVNHNCRERKIYHSIEEAYTEGNCWELACVLHHLYGYEIVLLYKYEDDPFGSYWHVLCKKDDLYFDAKGIYKEEHLKFAYPTLKYRQDFNSEKLMSQIHQMTRDFIPEGFYVGWLTLQIAEMIHYFVESHKR